MRLSEECVESHARREVVCVSCVIDSKHEHEANFQILLCSQDGILGVKNFVIFHESCSYFKVICFL